MTTDRVVGDARRLARGLARRVRALRPSPSESELITEADHYWTQAKDVEWQNNSHWRDGDVFDRVEWLQIGADHYALFERLGRTLPLPDRLGRVVEWGCGGGANAVHFAKRADEFVAVDVSPQSAAECARQIAQVCSTPVAQVVASLPDPEATVSSVPMPCDVFLCLYVLELVPTREYGLRIMDIASELLREGGVAFVQTKYPAPERETARPPRRYRENLANMTKYGIEEFWEAAAVRSLEPIAVALSLRGPLGDRYAYYLLRRAATRLRPSDVRTTRPDIVGA